MRGGRLSTAPVRSSGREGSTPSRSTRGHRIRTPRPPSEPVRSTSRSPDAAPVSGDRPIESE